MDAAAAFHEARPSGPPEIHVNGIAGTPPRRTVESRSMWRSGSWAGAWARARAVTVFGLRRRADIRVARRRNRRSFPLYRYDRQPGRPLAASSNSSSHSRTGPGKPAEAGLRPVAIGHGGQAA